MTTQNIPPIDDVRPGKARSVGRRLLGSVAGLVIVVGGGFAWSAYQGHQDSANAPAVGECFKITNEDDDLEKVDCTGADAQYQVTSRADGTHDAQQACSDDPEAIGGYEYQAQSRSVDVTQFVLCVKDV